MAKKKFPKQRTETRGRKPLPPEKKAINVGFWVRREFVESIGGLIEARRVAKEAVESLALIRKSELV